jgi:hypothetical protein
LMACSQNSLPPLPMRLNLAVWNLPSFKSPGIVFGVFYPCLRFLYMPTAVCGPQLMMNTLSQNNLLKWLLAPAKATTAFTTAAVVFR